MNNKEMICHNCGKQRPESAGFCPFCGAAAVHTAAPAGSMEPAKKVRGRGLRITAAVLAGLMILALGAAVLCQHFALAAANELAAELKKQNGKLEDKLEKTEAAAANWETIEAQLEIKTHKTDPKFWVTMPPVVVTTRGQMFSLMVYYERSGQISCDVEGEGVTVELKEAEPEMPLYRSFYITANEVGLNKLTIRDSESDTEITVLLLVYDNDYYMG